MKGKHRIVLETGRVKYDFTVRRNITVVQGDSATGKTTLIELLSQYGRQGARSGITLTSDVPCFVYTGGADSREWTPFFATARGGIIFVDEGFSFVHSVEFAECIKNTGDYYLLIARKPLVNLQYSIQEIYGIKTSGKYHFPYQVFHEFYPIYQQEEAFNIPQKIILLVEDGRSGYQFFSKVCDHLCEVSCESAGGNSNVYRQLLQIAGKEPVLVIADGAAFGSFVENVVSVARKRGNTGLYFPESFEWLILESGIIQSSEIEKVMKAPENYIESRNYFSWEQFFTAFLQEKTKGNEYLYYKKNHLPEFYLSETNRRKILNVLPEKLKELLNEGFTPEEATELKRRIDDVNRGNTTEHSIIEA